MRATKRLTRVTQDVSEIVHWKTELSEKAEKDSSRVLVPFARRGVLDS